MCENQDGSLQTGGALAVGDQKAQKHADGRGALLRRSPSAMLTGIEDKLPPVLRIKRAGIFSQLLQQITNGDAVAVESGIARPALLPHPVTE